MNVSMMWATTWHRHKWTTALMPGQQLHESYDRQHRMISLVGTPPHAMCLWLRYDCTAVSNIGTFCCRVCVCTVSAATVLAGMAVLSWVIDAEGSALHGHSVFYVAVAATVMLVVEVVLGRVYRRLHHVRSVTTSPQFWSRLRYFVGSLCAALRCCVRRYRYHLTDAHPCPVPNSQPAHAPTSRASSTCPRLHA